MPSHEAAAALYTAVRVCSPERSQAHNTFLPKAAPELSEKQKVRSWIILIELSSFGQAIRRAI